MSFARPVANCVRSGVCSPPRRGDLAPKVLSEAAARVARQVHVNSVTDNAYLTADGQTRPWSLDVLPMIVPADVWPEIEVAVQQTARLLNALAVDLYGDQRLIADDVIPPALVFGHAGFFRPAHGVRPAGGIFVHVAAVDLAHGPDGRWHITGVAVQVPSGLGNVLENRATIGRVFAPAARGLRIHALAPFCDAVRNMLVAAAPPDGDAPHVVLLSPGPASDTYFEHVYLSRELGLTLVHGADLVVRHHRVFLKTVAGLRRIHAIWRCQDDDICDPLELRSDSLFGVAGLVQAWRAGEVLIANAFGLAPLEAREFIPYLGPACERLLDEPLAAAVVPEPRHDELSRAPVWRGGSLVSSPVTLRAFAVADGRGGYRVLPGGLTRVLDGETRPGLSKDTWVGSLDQTASSTSRETEPRAPLMHGGERATPSRTADHLFWLGRYAERAENNARLIRAVLKRLPDARTRPVAFRSCLVHTCQSQGLIEDVPARASDVTDRVLTALERSLVAGLSDPEIPSLAFNVRQTWRVASAVRERLSSDNWRVLIRLDQTVSQRQASPLAFGDPFEYIDDVILLLVAVGGLETAHMTRDDGWRFLSLGRHIERLSFVAETLESITLHRAMHEPMALEWLLDLSDSLMTYRSRHLRQPEWTAVLDLLLFDERNPRAGMFQLAKIETMVENLPGAEPLDVLREIEDLHGAGRVSADRGHELFGGTTTLGYLPRACRRLAERVSDAITLRYFSHVDDRTESTVTP